MEKIVILSTNLPDSACPSSYEKKDIYAELGIFLEPYIKQHADSIEQSKDVLGDLGTVTNRIL